jgi:lipoprotein-anchoring transpeptidase ErfK/SrfK
MLRRVIACVLFALLASPALACNIFIVVDISDQKMFVAVDGKPSLEFDVSTGRQGYSTPTGRYGVERMYRKYHSKKYDGAPMPYSIFFHDGFAIHGTTDLKRLGTIASHGCVRLHPDNAKALFELVKGAGTGNTTIRVMS